MSTTQLLALVFFFISFGMAIAEPANFKSPLLWAFWAADVVFLFGGVGLLAGKVFG